MEINVLYTQFWRVNFGDLFKENEIEEIKKRNNLEEEDGPIRKRVEEILQGRNIKRQAYHSNSFIGNHCHRVLKVSLVLCIGSFLRFRK